MKKLVLAVMMLVFSVGANAACTRNDLTGTWVVYTSGVNATANRCQLTFLNKGNNIAASCFDVFLNTQAGTFTVNSFDATCHLIASFSALGSTVIIDAAISKGKDSMSGMWVNNTGNNGAFNGSKQ